MSRLKLIATIVLIAPTIAFAQGDKTKKSAIQHITGEPYVYYYANFDGLPFYDDDWVKGDITLLSGETYTNLQLRYDTYRDELIYINNVNNNVIIIDKKSIREFILTNKLGQKELFKPIVHPKLHSASGNFFAIILEDSISVVKKYETHEEMYNDASANTHKISHFVHKMSRYTWNNESLSTIPKWRWRLYKQFPEHKEELRHFCLHHHIHMKSDADLRLLYTEVNRLIKSK